MEQVPGFGSSASKIEGLSGGGSTSISDRRESDRDSEASQDPNTTTEQVDGSKGTDDSNGGTDVSGLQTTGANEDADSSKDDHASEQGRPSLGPVSAGNADIQQTSENWIFVDRDVGTLEKGGTCTEMEKKNAGTVSKEGLCQQISKVHNPLPSDDTTREKSFKNDPVVAEVGGTEGGCAADADEVDAQVGTEGSCEAPLASSQGPQSSPAAVALPGIVGSRAQGAQMLCNSRSVKETRNLSKVPHSLRTTKSLRHTPSDPKSPTEIIVYPSSARETSIGEETPSTGLVSGSQKESKPTSEAPSTASTAEPQVEVDMSQGDSGSVSASGAQEKSSEVSGPPSTVALDSETQKEAGLCVELPRAVARSESCKEAFTSPEAAGKMPGSEVQGGNSVVVEAPCSVPTSGALSGEPNSVVQEDVDSPSEALSTSAVNEDSVDIEGSIMVSNCEVSKDVGSTSSDSPNTVRTPEEIRKSSSTDSAVRNEVSTSADPPNRFCEGEISVVSVAPSAAPASEAQKGVGPIPEKNVPENLRRTVSQAGEEKPKKSLPASAQQSETTVSGIRGSPPRPRSAGGETSVPEEDTAVSQTSTDASRYEEQLAKKDKTIAELRKTIGIKEALFLKKKAELGNLEQSWGGLFEEKEGLRRENAELLRENAELSYKHAELLEKYQNLRRAYSNKETECTNQHAQVQRYANAYAKLKDQMKTSEEQDRLIRDLRGQLEKKKKECSALQDQVSSYEQQHANEQSRGGSYLDDTKAATPALLVSSLNGVKDASNNLVKVLKSSIQPGIEPAALKNLIGPVSRNGHTKFQYQALVCRVLFHGFELPYTGVSKAVLPPTTYFRQYQHHDLKKSDTVERLLSGDRDIDPSLHEFCFDKFLELMDVIQHWLIEKSVDLRQLVQNKQHPRESKLYVSFCKLAVSVWLLQRLAFSFLHPAKPFDAKSGEPFDLDRMQSVVPLDEPSADEEVELKVGFYVLPGFDVGNSAIPCEVYVALK